MRKISPTTHFQRDFKREKSGKFGHEIDELLAKVLLLLSTDKHLPKNHQDHLLTGQWKNHRECHIKPDLLLIYKKPTPELLQLIRLGSHSKLFR